MRLFKSDWVDRVLQALKVPDDVPIENKPVTNAIASAQGQVESQNFESRKNVLKYDDVMSRQREVIYGERREVLEGADLHEQVRTMIDEVVAGYVTGATEGFPEEWDLDALWTALKPIYPVSLRHQDSSRARPAAAAASTATTLLEDLQADAQAAYDAREAEVGAEVMRELERRVLLSVLDRKWREHLYEMDYLREGIGLRAYSQRDPLVEYQREGFDMFNAMMDGISEESVGFLFNLEVQVDEDEDGRRRSSTSRAPSRPTSCRRLGDASTPTTRGRSGPPSAHAEHGPPRHVRSPHIRAKGLERRRAAEPDLLRPERGRRGRGQRADGEQRRRPVRRRRPQRGVPLRLGQEVQEVPRRAGGADRPDRPRCRLAEARLAASRTPGPCTASGPAHLEARGEGAGPVAVAHADADLERASARTKQVCTLAHLTGGPAATRAPPGWWRRPRRRARRRCRSA